MQYLRSLCIAMLGIVFAASPSLAHHAIASEFDATRIVKFKGIVTLIARMNPHSLIFVDVRNDKKEMDHWALETLNTMQLDAFGLGVKGALKVGDTIEACGYATKDGVDPTKSYQAPEPISLSLKSNPRPVYSGRLMAPKILTLSESQKRLLGKGQCDEIR